MKQLKDYIYEGLFDNNLDSISTELNNYIEYVLVKQNNKVYLDFTNETSKYIRGIWVNDEIFEIDGRTEIPFESDEVKVKIALSSDIDNLGDIVLELPIKTIDFSHFDGKNIKDFKRLFTWHKFLEDIKFGNAFKNVKLKSLYRCFNKCEKIKSIDLSGLDLSQVESFKETFNECENLEEVNFSNVDVSSVENTEEMFNNCPKLKRLIGFENLIWGSVSDTNKMFYGCELLIKVDFGKNIFPNLRYTDYMFGNCKNLKTVEGFNNWSANDFNISCNYMFWKSGIETINLEKLNPDESTGSNFSSMFEDCNKLKYINLSSLKYTGKHYYDKMFGDVPYKVEIINNYKEKFLAKSYK
jgi:surface protein